MGTTNLDSAPSAAVHAESPAKEPTRLRDLSSQQKKSGLAAWLGWMFDGLDMHLYTIVALPFVAELMNSDTKDPEVGYHSSVIMGAFLIGWALGGGFFGRIADRLGRSRALMLTILTYSMFTGLSYFAQTWWHLLIFRFLAALGIGGEWAVGASLLSETWPRRWRPWMAAVLQTGVNIGVMFAVLATHLMADLPRRSVFLVGVLPALLVLWIRRAVPETEEWQAARHKTSSKTPGFLDLFRGPTRRITILTMLVCSLSLSAHWAFMFWAPQHVRNLPDLNDWTAADKTRLVGEMYWVLILSAIAGNFFAAFLARKFKYRWAIALLCFGYFVAMLLTYRQPVEHKVLYFGFIAGGIFQGVFALFTMYLPPLFPTLLRSTGAGFCYNIGRITAGLWLVFFGHVDDFRMSILYASILFIPAGLIALMLPEPPDEIAAAPIGPEG